MLNINSGFNNLRHEDRVVIETLLFLKFLSKQANAYVHKDVLSGFGDVYDYLKRMEKVTAFNWEKRYRNMDKE